jgi:hypothetical protein
MRRCLYAACVGQFGEADPDLPDLVEVRKALTRLAPPDEGLAAS